MNTTDFPAESEQPNQNAVSPSPAAHGSAAFLTQEYDDRYTHQFKDAKGVVVDCYKNGVMVVAIRRANKWHIFASESPNDKLSGGCGSEATTQKEPTK